VPRLLAVLIACLALLFAACGDDSSKESEATPAPAAEEVPIADGAAEPTPAQAEELPTTAVEAPKEPPRAPEPRVEPEVAKKEAGGPHVLASPAVRARARDLGIDLGQVKITGDRVRHSDLDAYLLYNGGSVSTRGAGAPRNDETIKVVGLRRKIAENMAEANRRIQHFTLVEEFDVTALEEARQMMNRDRGDNPKLTLLPFLITAMSRALADWPMLNATFDDEAMKSKPLRVPENDGWRFGVFVMSCCRKIDPDPIFTRHCWPGNIWPGVKITAQLLKALTRTIVKSVRKIEKGLTSGRATTTSGVGLTTPKYLIRTSSHAAATGIHETTMSTRRRDFMGEPR